MTQASNSKRLTRARRSIGKPKAADGTDRSRADKRRPMRTVNAKAPRAPRPDKAPAPLAKREKKRLPLIAAAEPGAASKSKAHCTACGLCCSYVAIEVDGPTTVKAATQLLWYVYHENVSLYVNADDWMVQFETTCVHLQADYRCGIYDTRPHICREFSEQDCEVNTGDDGRTFYTADEFMVHLKETRPRVHAFVRKHFSPPDAGPRTRKEPFEQRFAAVLARRAALQN